METQRHGWDTRAWAFGFVSGNARGAVLFAYADPAAQLHILIGGRDAKGALFIVLLITGFLLAPAVTSGMARRRPFWWGLLPLCLMDLWLVGIDVVRNNGKTFFGSDWWILPVLALCCWIISSGPVSLVRWLLRRAREKREQAVRTVEGLRESASVPQEGVWPPPPEHRP